jgi:endonuclease-3
MTVKNLYNQVALYFESTMPLPETELHYRNTFELLVAVILSAQCTDKRVNIVTPALFESFPTAELLSQASFEDVFELIKSISYPNNKAKHLIGMAQMLMLHYKGEVPSKHEDLIKLQGVGRKTANVIVAVAFNTPAIAVDTHVFRVSQRIGLVTPSTTPLQVENQLVKHIPKKLQLKFHHWLILHGRYTCLARTPKCKECGINHLCTWKEKVM